MTSTLQQIRWHGPLKMWGYSFKGVSGIWWTMREYPDAFVPGPIQYI